MPRNLLDRSDIATKGGSLPKTDATRQTTMSRPPSDLARPVDPSVSAAGHPEPTGIPATKRAVDLLCVLIALPLLIPLMLLIAAYIKLVSPGPVFYRQYRIGYRERWFQLLKFRSMRVNADSTVHEDHTTRLFKNNLPLTKMDAAGDARLILLGGLFRSSGLDELPQVLNVLRGEMSLVGPRPCTKYEYALLDPPHKERFNVLPGITGLWQVSGKNSTTFRQMMDLDSQYARTRSLWLDLRIMARTVPVLGRQICELLKRRLPAWWSGHR